jgi:hypothetical protein
MLNPLENLPMTEARKFSIIKPTLESPFHIDFDWWKANDNDWRVFLIDYLCPEHRLVFQDADTDKLIDWVDKETAEVHSLDGIQHTLIAHCAKESGFVSTNTAIVDAVFRTFLANENKPLSPNELSERIQQPASKILLTFGGFQVYKGIRPFQE